MFTNNPAGAANVNLYPTTEVVADCTVFGVTVPLISNDVAPSAAPTTAAAAASVGQASTAPIATSTPVAPQVAAPGGYTVNTMPGPSDITSQEAKNGMTPETRTFANHAIAQFPLIAAAVQAGTLSSLVIDQGNTAANLTALASDGDFVCLDLQLPVIPGQTNYAYTYAATTGSFGIGTSNQGPTHEWLNQADVAPFIKLAVTDICPALSTYLPI